MAMERRTYHSIAEKAYPPESSRENNPSPHPEEFANVLKVPSSFLAIAGIALITFGREAFRYPTTLQRDTFDLAAQSASLLNWLEPAVALAALFLLALLTSKKSRAARVFSLPPLIAAAVVMTIAGLPELLNVDLGFPTNLLAGVGRFCGYLLFGAWAYQLYRLKGRVSLIILASAFFLSGLLQILAVLLQPDATRTACLLSPAISMLFYGLFLRRVAQDERDGEEGSASATSPSSLISQGRWTLPNWLFLTLMTCFACYGLLSFGIHSHWNTLFAEDLVFSECQMVGGLGVLGASFLVLSLSSLRVPLSSDLFFLLVKAILFCLFALAICNALFQQTDFLVSLNFFLLDASHKLILIVIWAAPLYLKIKRDPLCLFSLSLGVYQTGALLAKIFLPNISSSTQLVFACLAFVAFDLCAEMYFLLNCGDSHEREESAMGQTTPEDTEKAEGYERILFRTYLADSFGLTKRETELVESLDRGTTLKDISEALFISFETAKTHRRNALKKLEVSSDEELGDKLKEIRSNEFRQYLEQQVSR